MSPSNATVARVVLVACAVAAAFFVGIYALNRLGHILTLLVVAAFIAVILAPPVDHLVRRAHFKRGYAVTVVFIAGVVLFSAMTYAFVRPIVDQSRVFVEEFPSFVDDAKAGRGRVGELVQRYNLDDFVVENQDRLEDARSQLGSRAVPLASTVASSVAALLTVLVLSILMLAGGPDIQRGILDLIDNPITRERLRRLAHDSAMAVTRYMAGNLIISLIAGIASYIALTLTGTPFNEVLALWVAFADLIPLVGATLGAAPAVLVAFLHSTTSGVIVLLFFILYQQFENHVLQVTIMSRSVRLNPLAVLVSVLVGVELFGILGALLAIPAAGVVQVVLIDLVATHRAKRAALLGPLVPPVAAQPTPED